jgi:hypothetical protein
VFFLFLFSSHCQFVLCKKNFESKPASEERERETRDFCKSWLLTLHSDGLQEIAHGFMSVREREWIRDVFF